MTQLAFFVLLRCEHGRQVVCGLSYLIIMPTSKVPPTFQSRVAEAHLKPTCDSHGIQNGFCRGLSPCACNELNVLPHPFPHFPMPSSVYRGHLASASKCFSTTLVDLCATLANGKCKRLNRKNDTFGNLPELITCGCVQHLSELNTSC